VHHELFKHFTKHLFSFRILPIFADFSIYRFSVNSIYHLSDLLLTLTKGKFTTVLQIHGNGNALRDVGGQTRKLSHLKLELGLRRLAHYWHNKPFIDCGFSTAELLEQGKNLCPLYIWCPMRRDQMFSLLVGHAPCLRNGHLDCLLVFCFWFCTLFSECLLERQSVTTANRLPPRAIGWKCKAKLERWCHTRDNGEVNLCEFEIERVLTK
jgi:hypothetical protein